MQKILVLGGTLFVGRVLVEHLQAAGYAPTLFNRGKTNHGLFPELPRISGDREREDITKVPEQDWDIIFDINAYFPRSLERLADSLRGRVGRYVFVSTGSVYDLDACLGREPVLHEGLNILPCTDEQKTNPGMETYGQRKAECERVLLAREWLDPIILRPALIYGKYDISDRMYYWLQRTAMNSRLLMPEGGQRKTALTLVDDLARAMVACIDSRPQHRVYNAGTHPPVSFADIVRAVQNALANSPEWHSLPAEFLEQQQVGQWVEMPLWLSGVDFCLDNSRLFADLLPEPTSLEEGLRRTAEFFAPNGWKPGRYGMSPEREQELIDRYLAAGNS